MHQGRHWPHQVLGHELSQNLTKSSTAPLNVKWKHHPKHCGIQIFDNHQPVSVCKKWLKYYPTTWMDRGRKVGRFMSLPFLKPSSDLPSTHLPAMDVDFGPIRGLSTKRRDFGQFSASSSHWAFPRPRRALDEAEASICQNLSSIAWMNMDE